MLNTLVATAGNRIVEPLRWLIVAGIAYTLATSVLFFVSGPDNAAVTKTSPDQRTKTPDRSSNVSINAIVSRNLFGMAGAGTAAIRSDTPAVETRLPLELHGVFVADEIAGSAAIVAQKGKPGQLYKVGAMLPGNAELIDVRPDHIVLRRAGSREILRFPEFSSGLLSAGPVNESRATVGGRASGLRPQNNTQNLQQSARSDANATSRSGSGKNFDSPREFIDAYRDRISEDPEGALRELGFSPVSASGSDGYRLDALSANSPYLSQTGLQPGDVILSVNGQPVGNIQRDQQQIDNVLAQGSARLEVQRGTRRFFVTASLN